MRKQTEQVKEFYKKFNIPKSETIKNVDLERGVLRYSLMREENNEYLDAVIKQDLTEVADALGDKLYILIGTILEHGLQDKIVEVFDEIHASNMSKLDDNEKPILRSDGKILKGKNYFKPNIETILKRF